MQVANRIWEIEYGIPVSWVWNEDIKEFQPEGISQESFEKRQQKGIITAIVQTRRSTRSGKTTEKLQAWKNTIRQPRVSNSITEEILVNERRRKPRRIRKVKRSDNRQQEDNEPTETEETTDWQETQDEMQQAIIEQQMEDIQQSTGIQIEKETIERIQRRASRRRRRRMSPRLVNTREFLLNNPTERDALEPIDNVPTHQPTLEQRPVLEQRPEESNDQFQDRVNQQSEFEQARENFHRQKEEEASKYDYLVGRCFVHPNTKRLYEVVRIYWNRRRNEYAAYRQPIDGDLAMDEDKYSFSVEGFNGVKELTHRYSKNAGDMGMLCSWPQSEKEMLILQQQDPICSGIIDKINLQRETRPEMVLYQGDSREGNAQYYQPTLANGERGAVRVSIKTIKAEKAAGHYMTEEEDEQGMGQLQDDPTYLPYQIVNAALRYYHDAMGHSGLERLHMSLKLKYFWTNMYADVKRYVTACRPCKLRKAGRTQAKTPLQTLNIPVRPFQRVYIDLVICKPSARGYQYICVMQDALTKWVELVPLRDKTAATVAQAITEYITLRHGSIDHLVTDKGSEFRNFTMQELNFITRTRHHIFFFFRKTVI